MFFTIRRLSFLSEQIFCNENSGKDEDNSECKRESYEIFCAEKCGNCERIKKEEEKEKEKIGYFCC